MNPAECRGQLKTLPRVKDHPIDLGHARKDRHIGKMAVKIKQRLWRRQFEDCTVCAGFKHSAVWKYWNRTCALEHTQQCGMGNFALRIYRQNVPCRTVGYAQ